MNLFFSLFLKRIEKRIERRAAPSAASTIPSGHRNTDTSLKDCNSGRSATIGRNGVGPRAACSRELRPLRLDLADMLNVRRDGATHVFLWRTGHPGV